jgi:hypothetical protein
VDDSAVTKQWTPSLVSQIIKQPFYDACREQHRRVASLALKLEMQNPFIHNGAGG